MAHAEPAQAEDTSKIDILAYLAARRAVAQSQLPSIINVPDGAYMALALVAVASLVALGWSPSSTPPWLAAASALLLMAGFAMKGVFGALMLYEGWQRWRQQRRDGGGSL